MSVCVRVRRALVCVWRVWRVCVCVCGLVCARAEQRVAEKKAREAAALEERLKKRKGL